VNGDPDYLLVFRIFYRQDKVVRTSSGNAFWRVADKKKRLREEEIRELQIDKGEIDFSLTWRSAQQRAGAGPSVRPGEWVSNAVRRSPMPTPFR